MKFKILSLVLLSIFMSACSTTGEPLETSEQQEPVDPAVAENDRNAAREADLNQMAVALEFYNEDNGSYPAVGGCVGEDSELLVMLRDYLAALPTGQSGVDTLCKDEYFYQAYADGSSYVLAAELEEADGFETYIDGVYCNIPDTAFFTDATVLSDLALEGQVCIEGQETSKFYVLTRESK